MTSAIRPKTFEHNPPIKSPNLITVDHVIRMINEGNIVALHSIKTCQIYHNLKEVDLSKLNVIYIDLNSYENLLGEGEWEHCIHENIPTVTELPENDLRNKIIKQVEVPRRTYLNSGY